MHIRARVLPVASALVFLWLASAFSASAQDRKSPQKVDKVQQAEMASLVRIVDNVMAGQAAPADFTFSWLNHAMKSRDNKEYVPFLLTFDKDQKLPPTVYYYIRVVNKAAIGERQKALAAYKNALDKAEAAARLDPENPDLAEAASKLRAEAPKAEYAFEDMKTFNLTGNGGSAFRIPAALMVAAGDYDVYVLLKEPTANVKDKKAQPRAGLLKTTLTVPNYWNDELATSSILITNQVEQLKTKPTQDDVNKNPYLFGMTRVSIPLEAKFAKKDELTIIFYIYNTGFDKMTGKPDVSVDYNFYRKVDGVEKFFNRTQPQLLNASTLDPQFDPKAGHQVPGGLAIPLASFPEGDYRLEIKVTDKVTGKTKVENSQFTVIAG
jgi:hypothetical protein